MSQKRDLLSAVDLRIDQKKTELVKQGIVQSVSSGMARVNIVGVAHSQDAYFDSRQSISSGDNCILVRPATSDRWIIVSSFGTPRNGRAINPSSNSQLAPPKNVRASASIPAHVVIAWDAPPQADVAFEVVTSQEESGEDETLFLTTRGSYAIINSERTTYARVRSVASDFRRSAWSPKVSISPASALQGFFLESVFDYHSPFPLVIETVRAGTYIDEVQLFIETAFNAPAIITVGEQGGVERLLAATDSDLTETGVYSKFPNYTYAGSTELHLYLTLNGATQGRGKVNLLIK